MRILVIHGPNLNFLGQREPDIYGSLTLDEINNEIDKVSKVLEPVPEIDFFQSNSEGDIVSKIQTAFGDYQGLLINPAAFTHTSVSIRDALLSTDIPTIEVHISNIFKREEFRKKSFISDIAIGVISGLGLDSYTLGLRALVNYLNNN